VQHRPVPPQAAAHAAGRCCLAAWRVAAVPAERLEGRQGPAGRAEDVPRREAVLGAQRESRAAHQVVRRLPGGVARSGAGAGAAQATHGAPVPRTCRVEKGRVTPHVDLVRIRACGEEGEIDEAGEIGTLG